MSDGAAAPRHIGIVACSAEGAALCYRTICAEGGAILGEHAHPDVSIHSPSFARYHELLERDDWLGVGDLMLDSARKLAQIGCRLPHLPGQHDPSSASVHRVPLAVTVARHRRGRCGTSRAARFPKARNPGHALARRRRRLSRQADAARHRVRTPHAEEREEIHGIIMHELVHGVFKPESVASFQRVIERMKQSGCDAVVLGCTEIPLIVNDSNSALPTLDSTRLLARAALRRAIAPVTAMS